MSGGVLEAARAAAGAAVSRAGWRAVGRVARKEVQGAFSSLAALMFIGAFLAASLFTFFWVETFFARNVADVRPLFEWMPILLIVLVSALTMRMWSEERRSGALELLLTAPVRPVDLVLGKFFACLALVAAALALTLPLPITAAILGPLDWGPVIGGYVAALCLAAAYIAIGLFVSARSESQIVSLIVTALICAGFFLIGSDAVTGLVGGFGATLRPLGAGVRFEAITRGVLDLRDIYYYVSIVGLFLVLNLWALERLRWASGGTAARRARRAGWVAVAALAGANLLAGNLWLGRIEQARIDLTEDAAYSISEATRGQLAQLTEPLLIRGYFSRETHPLLAPLTPRLTDLLREYEVAGGGRVRVEIVDPAEEPELEEEAGRRFGLRPTPFQTSSRYQAAVTNSYFDLVVQYGDEFETLGFAELIDVRQGAGANGFEVALRNPEYDLTRAIRKTVAAHRSEGDLFEGLTAPAALTAYVSPDAELPEPLPELRAALAELMEEYRAAGGDKFVGEIVDPTADGGATAEALSARFGLRPLSAGLLSEQSFWFHLVLGAGERLLQLPLPEELDGPSLRRVIEAELKRLAPGALRTVALHAPTPDPAMAQFGLPPSTLSYRTLQARLTENAVVETADLAGGRVPDAAEVLILAGPEALSEEQVFAVDQFLMRGGAVVISASAFRPQLSGDLTLVETNTGLDDWLAHHGLSLEPSLVIDPENTPFPLPTVREVSGLQVREIQLLDYPHFVDVRDDGLAQQGAPTAGLGRVTAPWASPIALDEAALEGRRVTRLIESSPASRASASREVVPDPETHGGLGFADAEPEGRRLIGVAAEGAFRSFFADRPAPLLGGADASAADPAAAGADAGEAAPAPRIAGVIERAPETAKIVLYASSALLSDEALELIATVDRSGYLAPALLIENTVDWALEDRELLELRARQSVFARRLEPMSAGDRVFWESLNYGLALAGLLALYAARRRMRARAAARERALFGPGAAGGGDAAAEGAA